MSRSVSKLVPKVPPLPGVPGTSRRQQFSASTKRALVEVAEQLFTANGYSSTSLDAIVAGADVTKGALYHHFSGKQALFEAVFEKVEAQAAQDILQAIKGVKDPWEKAAVGLRSFLDVVQQPAYRRLVVQEGPAVLGYERYREQEERSAFAVVVEIVGHVLATSGEEIGEELTDTFARLFFGALSAAGESVATAEDPNAAADLVETAVSFILAGIRSVIGTGLELASPETPEPAESTEVD